MGRTRSTDAHNRVLEAALELFVKKGIEASSMDAIAAASGVSKATIYKHWRGRDALLMEVLVLVVGIEENVAEEDCGDLFTDLARVLNDKPRNARPEEQKRLMPQMVAYSATHQEFGDAWRSRVMEVPKRRIRRILVGAMADGRLPEGMDMDVSFALLLGPMMYKHIFGRHFEGAGSGKGGAGQSILGTAKSIRKVQAVGCECTTETDTAELGSRVAEAFCRAFEIPPH
jgi:AcrR family transcriptional regulator